MHLESSFEMGQPGFAPIDVLAMGSLFLELTPDQPGASLRQMRQLIPTASGAAANFALALSALGLRTGIFSAVGADEAGQWLLDQIGGRGIDTSSVRLIEEELTTLSLASADLQGGKLFRFYRVPGASDPLSAIKADALSPAEISRAQLLDFSEAIVRNETTRETVFTAAEYARNANRSIVYAVNYRSASWRESPEDMVRVQCQAMGLADVVVMNQEEWELLTGVEWANKLIQSLTATRLFVITAGDRGGWYVDRGERRAFGAPSVKVAYDVGAGDAFHAGLVAALFSGEQPDRAVTFAAATAALKVSLPPSSPPPTRIEVQRFLAERNLV